ncbi:MULTISPECIES: hypothetical protein [Colwelliaceae]|uniref:hypothetical protein n=1 Tax=Colwelliaceae TaxID=267889 RepID=UPI0009706223|nr:MULTISPECIES: hypothetical protein [Colwelliaceae]
MFNPSIPTLLRFANVMIALTLIITLSAIALVYGMDEKLTIVEQIAGHITIMIMPALFKLSYVLRLFTLKELGLKE